MELVDKIVDLIALIPGTFWGVVDRFAVFN